MRSKTLTRSLLAASVLLGIQSQVQAADIRMNGFVSIGAGKTLSEGDSNIATQSPKGKSTFTADIPTAGVYDDTIDFKPDSIYGIQFTANLGDGLSVTGQVTGAGGEDFDSQVSWAYVSYDLNDSWTVLAGRQRIPFFFYSDFLDVGYAYHWMRVPTETNVVVDTFDGAQLRWTGSMGSWDSRVQFFGGTNEADGATTGPLGLDNMLGAVFYTSNDWLQLRATYMAAEIWIDSLTPGNVAGLAGFADDAKNSDKFLKRLAKGQSADEPIDIWFGGVAAHATFGNFFTVAEYTYYEFDEPLIQLGQENQTGTYISFGYRMGSLTPHITFSHFEQDATDYMALPAGPNGENDIVPEATEKSDSVTVGVRWDFHPSAALKFEYQTTSHDIDDGKTIDYATSGRDIEDVKGDWREVDLISVGIDVIF